MKIKKKYLSLLILLFPLLITIGFASWVIIYTIEFQIAPYTLNAGRYKTEIFFGENQRYVVFSGFEQCFEIENSLSDMGFNQNVMPGFLRPKNNFKVTFEG